MRKLLLVIFAAALLASCAKNIPPAEPFNPESSFKEANRLLEKKKYEEARRELYDIKRKEAELKYAPLAQLRIADSYLEEKEEDLAVEEYRRFIEEYPSHKYAAYARYRLGMIYFDLIEGHDRGFGAAEKALDEFEALNALYPRNPYRTDAEERIQKCMDVLAGHEFMVGSFYYKRKAWQGAIDRYLGLLERFPGYKEEADVLYRVAASYEALGEKDKAGQYYDRLLAGYPDSKPAKKAKKELISLAK